MSAKKVDRTRSQTEPAKSRILFGIVAALVSVGVGFWLLGEGLKDFSTVPPDAASYNGAVLLVKESRNSENPEDVRVNAFAEAMGVFEKLSLPNATEDPQILGEVFYNLGTVFQAEGLQAYEAQDQELARKMLKQSAEFLMASLFYDQDNFDAKENLEIVLRLLVQSGAYEVPMPSKDKAGLLSPYQRPQSPGRAP